MGMRTVHRDKKPSLVPPPAAAVASLVVPGFGQMLTRQVWRGLLIMGSLASIVALFIWRVNDIAHREVGVLAMVGRSLQRRPLFVVIVLIGIVLMWALNVWDAYRQAQPGKQPGTGIFILIAVVFFVLGWQISEIDLEKAVVELPDALPPLSRVLWPWEAAFTRETETVSAEAPILSPCDDNPPPPPEEIPGEPYLVAEPTCGDLSDLDENNDVIPGTTLHLIGRGFAPNTETQIWWEDPIGQEFRVRKEGEYLTVMTDSEGSFETDVVMPYRLIPPSAEGRLIHFISARQTSEVGGLLPSEPLMLTIERMVETIFLGMMATAFGIVFSIPISFLAARNLMSGSWLSLLVYYLTRTVLNIIRSIEPLIWALIAVVWVGLGPFAGIIALTVHSIAALGKLYSEAIEGIDAGPIEAIQATGATSLQTIMYAVIPQMIPPFVSFSIYRWDINVRMSTVIGLVGGGGIGFILIQYIRLLDYRAAGIAVWFIAFTVAILDYVSSEIRQRFV
jgi:phosphonate transport system permease protein